MELTADCLLSNLKAFLLCDHLPSNTVSASWSSPGAEAFGSAAAKVSMRKDFSETLKKNWEAKTYTIDKS